MSLLAALKNKTQPLATAIPAIPAIRGRESVGGIAKIAGIAIATGQNEKDESASEQAANNETHPAPGLAEVINHMAGELGEGWSVDPDMPNRVVHVHQGRLLDSCIFRTTTGALELLRRLALGEPQTLAFYAACAFEDVLQALAACGWSGESAVGVARAIADGVTDETVLTAMLCDDP